MPETMAHLLLGCVFSRQLWFEVLRKLNLNGLVSLQEEDVFTWWVRERKAVPKVARQGFNSLFFLLDWSIWKERNVRTFDGPSTTPANLLHQVFDEAKDWMLAGYRKLGTLLSLL